MIVGCVVILFSTESPKTAKADCFLFQRNIKNCWGGGRAEKNIPSSSKCMAVRRDLCFVSSSLEAYSRLIYGYGG